MIYFEFSQDEKAKMFDEIAAHFYYRNFGQMTKTEIDLMMFHFYYEKLISSFKDSEGNLDYKQCSDYRISRELGITQQRVRNYKVKNQLVYPSSENRDWRKEFSKLIENARYDRVSKKIIVNIPDPNLYLDIQNFIEERGAYIEKQLNSKILQIRAEYFIDLAVSLEPFSYREEIVNELQKQLSENCKDDVVFDERNIGKSLIESTVNITTIAANLSNIISPQNTIGLALFKLLTQKIV